VNIADEVQRDRKRRLANQRAFPLCFVKCSCEQGCPVCAYTGLVSWGQAKQMGDQISPCLPLPKPSSF
jgi:hypothetical protein